MSLSPITPALPPLGSQTDGPLERAARSPQPTAEEVSKAAKQFEAILVRQFIEPTVNSMFASAGGGPGGESYAYFMVDSLASQIAEGGGLGLSSILEMQFAGLVSDEPEPRS